MKSFQVYIKKKVCQKLGCTGDEREERTLLLARLRWIASWARFEIPRWPHAMKIIATMKEATPGRSTYSWCPASKIAQSCARLLSERDKRHEFSLDLKAWVGWLILQNRTNASRLLPLSKQFPGNIGAEVTQLIENGRFLVWNCSNRWRKSTVRLHNRYQTDLFLFPRDYDRRID